MVLEAVGAAGEELLTARPGSALGSIPVAEPSAKDDWRSSRVCRPGILRGNPGCNPEMRPQLRWPFPDLAMCARVRDAECILG